MRACLARLPSSGTRMNESGTHMGCVDHLPLVTQLGPTSHRTSQPHLAATRDPSHPDHHRHTYIHTLRHSVTPPWVPGLGELITKEGSECCWTRILLGTRVW